MAKSRKYLRIKFINAVEAIEEANLRRDIENDLYSGKLFSLDDNVVDAQGGVIFNEKKNIHQRKFDGTKIKTSKNRISLNRSDKINPKRKIFELKKELDIWGTSIETSVEGKIIKKYPGELLRDKCPTALLPCPGQSVNPPEHTRHDAILQSSAISLISCARNNTRKNSNPTIDSYISDYYELSDISNLSETQKYYLFNSLQGGNLKDVRFILESDILNHNIDDIENEPKIKYRKSLCGRKKRSDINRIARRKYERLLTEKRTKLKRLNKDVENIGKYFSN